MIHRKLSHVNSLLSRHSEGQKFWKSIPFPTATFHSSHDATSHWGSPGLIALVHDGGVIANRDELCVFRNYVCLLRSPRKRAGRASKKLGDGTTLPNFRHEILTQAQQKCRHADALLKALLNQTTEAAQNTYRSECLQQRWGLMNAEELCLPSTRRPHDRLP